jgi:hypothetical protein
VPLTTCRRDYMIAGIKRGRQPRLRAIDMNRKPVSDPDLAAQGKFQGDIDRNSNFHQQALNHNLGRNVRVAQVLGCLALLRQGGTSLTGTVECSAAMLQNFSSSSSMTHMGQPAGQNQAAHFLPGRIRIGGQEIWEFARNPATRGPIEFLFAAVEHLPLAFNQADSVAEAKGKPDGLCASFANACATLIRRQVWAKMSAGGLNMELLQAGYDEWHRGAVAALRTAIANKGAKPGIPPLVGDRFQGYTAESISLRSTAPASQWNRDESLRVLQYYAEDQQQRTWQWVVGRCQWALRDVESGFKG